LDDGYWRVLPAPDDQYTSEAYHELLIRRFQYGAFCPIFRVHGYKSNAELWNYGPQVERILTQYDELRGLPLEFSFDPQARDVSDQFMFGATLLINPVTTGGATRRTLYLPAGGNWADFWRGKSLNGGKTITADAPLDRIPLYAKSGSIVAFGPPAESTSGKSDPIDLRIYPGADGTFTLYEDEATTMTMNTEPILSYRYTGTIKLKHQRSEIDMVVSPECWSTGPFAFCVSPMHMGSGSHLRRSSMRPSSSVAKLFRSTSDLSPGMRGGKENSY
jgi:alpha-glucosidase (family GH31 glycosyl hydrolase)